MPRMPRPAILLLLTGFWTVSGGRAQPSLRVEVLARSVAPGEAVRILVRSSVALVSVEGSFLGEPLFFAGRQDAGDDALPRNEWWAWAAVGLDEEPGPGSVEIRGRTGEGLEVRRSKPVRVAAKRFPTQRLEVESRYVTPALETLARIQKERERLAAVYSNRRASAPSPGPFQRPVPGEATSTFGTRRIFNGEPRDPHPGLDLRAAAGTPVQASGPGRVALAQDLYFSGQTVILDHGGGLFTVYAHLSRMEVKEGDEVGEGQVVGLAGATGRVTGPHLHWGAKVGDRPFDPTALLDPRLFPPKLR